VELLLPAASISDLTDVQMLGDLQHLFFGGRMNRNSGRIMLGVIVPLALTACGGGSGGVGSTPSPAPAPAPAPTPTNTDISDLRYSETFTTSGAHHEVSFDLSPGTTTSSSSAQGDLTIAYDAARGSYTVSAGARSVTFDQADEYDTGFQGETLFRKTVDGKSEHLTLTNIGYGSNLETTSVGLGYWQSNTVSGDKQDTQFEVFVYGFPSLASAVPRTGSASYAVDVFGFATPAGKEPLSFSGSGTMGVDFANANFSIDAHVYEYFLVSGDLVSAPALRAGGELRSSGELDGTFYYEHPGDRMSGTLNGSFFGPDADEVGGAFSGSGLPGSSVTGALTGRKAGPAPANMTLANLSANTILYGSSARLRTVLFADPGTPGQALTYPDEHGGLHYKFTEWDYVVPNSQAKFAAGDLKSSSATFDMYETTTQAGDIYRLSVFQPSGNGEIELTYSTFAEFHVQLETGETSDVADRTFITAGLLTPHGTLEARTGTATYRGIAFGSAATQGATRSLSISGTSQFDIDFNTEGYGGWLRLTGVDVADGSAVDFGRFELIPGTGFAAEGFRTAFNQSNPMLASDISMRFYGPTGEELSGAFNINTPDGYAIAGATVSVRD
jgi:hypothetical protein